MGTFSAPLLGTGRRKPGPKRAEGEERLGWRLGFVAALAVLTIGVWVLVLV
jgi:hypothetical protein